MPRNPAEQIRQLQHQLADVRQWNAELRRKLQAAYDRIGAQSEILTASADRSNTPAALGLLARLVAALYGDQQAWMAVACEAELYLLQEHQCPIATPAPSAAGSSTSTGSASATP